MNKISLNKVLTALAVSSVAGVILAAPAAAAPNELTLSNSTFDANSSTSSNFSVQLANTALTGSSANQGLDKIVINFPSDWTVPATCPIFTNRQAGNAAFCGISSFTINVGSTPVITTGADWAFYSNSQGEIMGVAANNNGIPTNQVGDSGTISIGFVGLAFVTGSTSGNFTMTTMYLGGATIYSGSTPITITGGTPATQTVSFSANGGTGAMADQSASSATALSANAFTRSGYTFTGWNTAADGSGTAYADGASYPFAANATLYAQWTATLATTGFDGVPYLFSGLGLAVVGGAFLLIARRKQNS